MKLWIPDIKDQFRLTEDWEFPLFLERRNDGLVTRWKPQVGPAVYGSVNESIGCCLLEGTVLQVDRVFIRQGQSNAWSSITFYIKQAPGDKDRPKHVKQSRGWGQNGVVDHPVSDSTVQKLKGARFWAKLANVNEIECEPIEEGNRIK